MVDLTTTPLDLPISALASATMHHVIHLVEELLSAGISVPSFPTVEAPEPPIRHFNEAVADQAPAADLEQRIEEWREEVRQLHHVKTAGMKSAAG